jgi:hypothetical protein
MPSERNAPAADVEDDIVERKPSNPIATTLLIISSVALALSIYLAGKELGYYVNPKTKSMTNGFKVKAVKLYEDAYEKAADAGSPER